jgi:hypothetical protein
MSLTATHGSVRCLESMVLLPERWECLRQSGKRLSGEACRAIVRCGTWCTWAAVQRQAVRQVGRLQLRQRLQASYYLGVLALHVALNREEVARSTH